MANSIPQNQQAQTQVKLIDDAEYKLNIYDYTIVPALSLAAAIWIFFHIWTAVNWDDLLYMSLSRHTVAHPWILNRYGHIYLQKLFFMLAGDSINGGRVFWCFLIFGTVVLTYFCCRLLFGKKGYICGIIAGLMVLMQHDFGKDAGCTLTDFTVMFLVTLGMFVYLTYLRHDGKWRRWLLMALGLIFFWAVKSKEVGVCFGVVFLGLFWDGQNRFSFSRFLREIRWVIAGMAAGCLLLMLLDMVFIGDMFFSIRPSNIAKVLNTNVHPPSARALSVRISMSWFSFLTMRALFVVFIFYILAGWKAPSGEFTIREKVLWVFPFVLIFFLTFIRTGFIIVPRYISSAVPVMSIWASSCFWFDMGSLKSDDKLFGRFPKAKVMWSLVVAALIIAAVIVSKQHAWALYYKFDNPVKGAFDLKFNKLTLPEEILYVLVLMPLFVTVTLIAGFFGKKR